MGVADQIKLHATVVVKMAGVGEAGIAFPPLERLVSGQPDFLPRPPSLKLRRTRKNTKGANPPFQIACAPIGAMTPLPKQNESLGSFVATLTFKSL
jgi:hypothetical protein